MSDIIIYPYNVLEDSTVTVTGTADTGYPESRLYDRHISYLWKDTVTEAKTFHADQGADDNKAIGALFIEQHNFSGEDMTFEYSTNDSDWSDAVSGWTQNDNDQIVKTLTALTKRYWRVTVTSMENPYCGEIYMSNAYTFEIFAGQPPSLTYAVNLQHNRTVGGTERTTLFGDKRRQYTCTILVDSTGLTSFRDAMDYLNDYSRPFYIKDHDANYWLARLMETPVEQYNARNNLTTINLSFIEMI